MHACGSSPVSISCSSRPSAYTSMAGCGGSPRNCSGAIVVTVPGRSCNRVIRDPTGSGSASPANPKSISTGAASGSWLHSNTLRGVRSRCTTPTACAMASASAKPSPTATTRGTGTRNAIATRKANVGPSIHSTHMNGRPYSSGKRPAPNARTNPGCGGSRAVSRTSRAKRCSPSRCGCITLSATSRAACRSCTRYTVPMPPRPSSARTTKRPAPTTARGFSSGGSR